MTEISSLHTRHRFIFVKTQDDKYGRRIKTFIMENNLDICLVKNIVRIDELVFSL